MGPKMPEQKFSGIEHTQACLEECPALADASDRHPGRTLILTVNHPTLGDGRLKPIVVEALKEYLARLERDEVGNQKTDSIELPSGARLDAVAFGPADLM